MFSWQCVEVDVVCCRDDHGFNVAVAIIRLSWVNVTSTAVCIVARFVMVFMLTGAAAVAMRILGNASEMENSTQTTTNVIEDPQWVPLDTFIGLILAFSSCLFIGISVIFKKLALRDIEVGDEGICFVVFLYSSEQSSAA